MSGNPLIPIEDFVRGFTTCSALHRPKLIHAPLSDKELGVHKATARLTHDVVQPPRATHCGEDDLPPPSEAWEAFFPKGSINPSAPIRGGFGFYLYGPADFLGKEAKEVVMSYRMMLDPDWDFVKGGKLPGVFGGKGDLSYRCTGGRQEERGQCFNLRLMWREHGEGELYAYLPMTENNRCRLLTVPPHSTANSDYGISVGRGSFRLSRGRWTTVAIRVRLNDYGVENGIIELWIDGKSVISVGCLTLRECSECCVGGMHFQTFFGGHTPEWASSKDQRAWFADITGVVVA